MLLNDVFEVFLLGLFSLEDFLLPLSPSADPLLLSDLSGNVSTLLNEDNEPFLTDDFISTEALLLPAVFISVEVLGLPDSFFSVEVLGLPDSFFSVEVLLLLSPFSSAEVFCLPSSLCSMEVFRLLPLLSFLGNALGLLAGELQTELSSGLAMGRGRRHASRR